MTEQGAAFGGCLESHPPRLFPGMAFSNMLVQDIMLGPAATMHAKVKTDSRVYGLGKLTRNGRRPSLPGIATWSSLRTLNALGDTAQ